MTALEFEQLTDGSVCMITKGRDAGIEVIALHKEKTFKSKVVLVKPLKSSDHFDSATVAYRYFKLLSHTELKILALA